MTERVLAGCRLLVVEDDYIVAMDICGCLEDAGAEIIGPVSSVDKALAVVRTNLRIDAALLDVNIRGERVFPVADTLAEQQVPFIFVTGYDQSAMPEKYRQFPRCDKPVNMAVLVGLIGRVLKTERVS